MNLEPSELEPFLLLKIHMLLGRQKLQQHIIDALEYHRRHGKFLPPGEAATVEQVQVMIDQKDERLRVLDLEIENTRLKMENAKLKAAL